MSKMMEDIMGMIENDLIYRREIYNKIYINLKNI